MAARQAAACGLGERCPSSVVNRLCEAALILSPALRESCSRDARWRVICVRSRCAPFCDAGRGEVLSERRGESASGGPRAAATLRGVERAAGRPAAAVGAPPLPPSRPTLAPLHCTPHAHGRLPGRAGVTCAALRQPAWFSCRHAPCDASHTHATAQCSHSPHLRLPSRQPWQHQQPRQPCPQ